MNYLRSRSLKRLLSLGRRSNADECAEECVDVDPPANKPTWRCFSYEELDHATNGFHQGTVNHRLACLCLFVLSYAACVHAAAAYP